MQSSEARPQWLYEPSDQRHDDMIRPDGSLRPHWHYVLDSLAGLDDLAARRQKALRILRDDGATYNIYAHGSVDQAPTWNLDLVPNIISSDEWADVESGLLERAELLNLLLRDLYGARTLIRTGVIPPEAVFCHRGFLRACHGIQLPGDHDLILHAVDMIRDPQQGFVVLGDRTQSPSGAGYALENRTVMSRVFPSLFRDSHVHRLAAFFQRLRVKLMSLSPNPSQARVVLLTPGPHNETYFEHAYLANYLGFPLVQSDDLVVRNGFLWMKSLDGLSRVDVLLRRVDDWFCDPVELRADSRLGVAGMLEVVRAGNLVVANPLGSGILENPVFLRYLPDIAKALLGRDLRLPSVTTYWCGDDADRAYVLSHLPELVIKPVYRSAGTLSIRASELNDEQRAALMARIQADPLQYIAQPALQAGHLPTLSNNQFDLVPRPAILRSYAVASGSSYTLMPGGLTRVGGEENSFVIASQAGARSKDTWVVASEPERISLSELGDDVPAGRETETVSLPSRVVENLFWMGRYAERAEAILRILRTTFIQFSSESPASPAVKRNLLSTVMQVAGLFGTETDPDTQLANWVQDGSLNNSIAGSLNAMLYCADQTKELLSSDTFRIINDIRDALIELPQALTNSMASAPEEVLDPLVTALMAFAGLTQESMNRSFGWRFMELGKRLERAQQINTAVTGLMGPVLSEGEQNRMAEALLLTMETLISYRRRYRGRMSTETTLDLILLDGSNPRSLMYQLNLINEHLNALPRPVTVLHELSAEQRTLMEAEVLVKLTPLKVLSNAGDGVHQELTDAMGGCKHLLAALNDKITDKFFDHRENSQQLVQSAMEVL
ncbi:circularly permuted type 2 ATP-grasp protein [Thalassolituus sp. LLYu03]|uniref:circularly permuted type 2 ATP-grasp protein n=1 Tax=Thalassolituus sp. LLYu03 TaxID=3421656 RepID=UPI003D26CBCA